MMVEFRAYLGSFSVLVHRNQVHTVAMSQYIDAFLSRTCIAIRSPSADNQKLHSWHDPRILPLVIPTMVDQSGMLVRYC